LITEPEPDMEEINIPKKTRAKKKEVVMPLVESDNEKSESDLEEGMDS